MTVAALEAGKHVLCEARMAMNAAEAHRMLEASRAHPDLVAQLVPAPMSLRVDPTVRRLLDEGYLGELLVANVRGVTGAFVDPEVPLHWRQDIRLSGLNALTMGIWHEILMRWVATLRASWPGAASSCRSAPIRDRPALERSPTTSISSPT